VDGPDSSPALAEAGESEVPPALPPAPVPLAAPTRAVPTAPGPLTGPVLVGELVPAPPGPAPAPGAAEPVDLVALREIEGWLARLVRASAPTAATSVPAAAPGSPSLDAVIGLATVLWFDALRAHDRVRVPPSLRPLLAAIGEILGEGPERRPIRRGAAGDPSTGDGERGPSATVWSALAQAYVVDHLVVDHMVTGQLVDADQRTRAGTGRQICLLEHTELLSPAVWETVASARARGLGEVLWIVSLPLPPSEAAARAAGVTEAARLFEAAGWQVLTLRHGLRLGRLFRRGGGAALRARLDGLSAPRYRELLAAEPGELRGLLVGGGTSGVGIARLLESLSDAEVSAAVRDLGGRDLAALVDCYDDVAPDVPTVLFAHTGDPHSGHPAGLQPGPGPAARALVARIGARLAREPIALAEPPDVPTDLAPRDPGGLPGGRPPRGAVAPLTAFADLLAELVRVAPEVAEHMVTAATVPAEDALTAWCDLAGRWLPAAAGPHGATEPLAAGEPASPAEPSATGRHIAGPITPGVLSELIGELGATWLHLGQPLLPVGLVDAEGAESALPAWAVASGADGQALLAVAYDTGARRGGRAGGGFGERLPEGVAAWEPAFAQDTVWCALAALGRLGRPGGRSALLRLSRRPVETALAGLPVDRAARARRAREVLAGGYRLRDGGSAPALTLVGLGVVMPEVLAAADELVAGLGREVAVVCVTSPDALFRALQARRGLAEGDAAVLTELFPRRSRCPLVTVVDGDPRRLAFLAGVHGDPISTLGSDGPPVPGAPAGTDPDAPVARATIVGAALDLLEELGDPAT